MSHKLVFIFLILSFAAIILVAEARGGGRGRGGSFGSTFYRRSHKKNNNNGSGRNSRRKVVSGSPVHTTYTKSMIAADSVDLKLGKHSRSRHRSSHTSHKSHSSNSGHSNHDSYNSHSSSKHADTSHYGHTQLGAQPHHYNTHYNTHSFSSLGPKNSYHNSPHVSQSWGGHQLPPGHVYITQPSSIPTHAVYYAQTPVRSSTPDNSADFALGYLVGSSLTHRHHHYHHIYSNQQDTSHHSYNEYAEDNTNTIAPLIDIASSDNHTFYWPTDTEVSLAPLNNTLLPIEVAQIPNVPIFKGPPKLSAQKLSIDNSTFELPAVTAAPPETPPSNGIICMPWTFNETHPGNSERIISVQKTVCFPAPPPPPAPQATTTSPPTSKSSTPPVAGDIGSDLNSASVAPKDKCEDAVCPSSIRDIDFTNLNFCCLSDDKLSAMVLNLKL
ncbi:mucin-5AC [Eurosta solidaginis]|uniref:mucin-5AC n=1 Tax=Eurosta solidaginis TaxID=178769 RepID=UPI003530DD49